MAAGAPVPQSQLGEALGLLYEANPKSAAVLTLKDRFPRACCSCRCLTRPTCTQALPQAIQPLLLGCRLRGECVSRAWRSTLRSLPLQSLSIALHAQREPTEAANSKDRKCSEAATEAAKCEWALARKPAVLHLTLKNAGDFLRQPTAKQISLACRVVAAVDRQVSQGGQPAAAGTGGG